VLKIGSGFAVVGGAVLFGLCLPWVIIGFNTALQRGTPGSLQGRAYSAADTILTIPQLASIAAGALLVDLVNYRILLGVMALVLASSAASLARIPVLSVQTATVNSRAPEAGQERQTA